MLKHLLFVAIGIAMMAGSASADRVRTPQQMSMPIALNHDIQSNLVKNGCLLKPGSRGNAPSKSITTPVISEVSGSETQYTKDCCGVMLDFWWIAEYADEFASSIVWGNNGEIYFKNIFSNLPTDTYVKGVMANDVITVELPQTIYYDEENATGLNLNVLKASYTEVDGQTSVEYVLDETVTSVSFVLDFEGNISLVLPGEPFSGDTYPEYALGLINSSDDSWAGYADFYQKYTPFFEEPTTMPEGLATTTYFMPSYNSGYLVNVGFTDENVYFQGLSQYMPESVVIGDIVDPNYSDEEMLVNIPQNQYIGMYGSYYYVFTKAVVLNPNYDWSDPESEYMYFAPDDAGYECIFNKVTKTFTPKDPDLYLSLNAAKDRVYYIELFTDLNLKEQTDFYGTPKNPEYISFSDMDREYYGYCGFYFNAPLISQEGILLDNEEMYYRIFINDELQVFQEHTGVDLNGVEKTLYPGLEEPTSLIPLKLYNKQDFIKFDPSYTEVGIYRTDVSTIGVQVIYTYGGTTTRSNLMTLDVATGEITETSDVKKIDSDAQIVGIEYYSLDGTKVINPDKGIYIQKATLADGNVVVKKVNIR